MRDIDPAFNTALINARERGIVPRKLVRVTGRSYETDEIEAMAFWSDIEERQIQIASGIDGSVANQLFYGGVALSVSPIPRVLDLTVQSVAITASQIAPAVQTLVRGMDLRLGKVEVWEALLDPTTRQFVSMPPLVWLGEVDGSPIETPSVNGEGSVQINTVSDAISMLTRKNPAKSSYEEQRKRQGDEWGKYAGANRHWKPHWGAE